MAKRRTATGRRRRARGSLDPQDIIDGAFELAAEVSLDGLSMPMLGRHLGVGVTSIYWYFRKKDDLLDAMTERALGQYLFETPLVDSGDWRETLRGHACRMRRTFLGNPVLCDLILIRSPRSQHLVKVGAHVTEQVIATLVDVGLPLDDACDTFSAIQLHVRGSVILQRLYDKNRAVNGSLSGSAYYESISIEPDTTPLLAAALADGRRAGAPDDRNFELGLDTILEHAGTLIAAAQNADRLGDGPSPDGTPPPIEPSTRTTAASTDGT